MQHFFFFSSVELFLFSTGIPKARSLAMGEIDLTVHRIPRLATQATKRTTKTDRGSSALL